MAVLDAVESDRAVIVSSYDNGMIAQLFAAARPDRVAGLVLIDSFVCPARTEQGPWMPRPGMVGGRDLPHVSSGLGSKLGVRRCAGCLGGRAGVVLPDAACVLRAPA